MDAVERLCLMFKGVIRPDLRSEVCGRKCPAAAGLCCVVFGLASPSLRPKPSPLCLSTTPFEIQCWHYVMILLGGANEFRIGIVEDGQIGKRGWKILSFPDESRPACFLSELMIEIEQNLTSKINL